VKRGTVRKWTLSYRRRPQVDGVQGVYTSQLSLIKGKGGWGVGCGSWLVARGRKRGKFCQDFDKER
jgi:hypothetical protein